MPPPPIRTKNVRKRSLFDRITAYPGDLWLKVMEDYETINWDRFHNALSWPVALCLNVLYLMCTLATPLEKSPSTYILPHSGALGGSIGASHIKKIAFEDDIIPFDIDWRAWIPSRLYYWVRTVEMILCVISIGNAIYLLTKRKRYYLHEVDNEDPPRSANIRRAPFDSSTSQWGFSFWGTLRQVMSIPFSPISPSTRMVWELDLWDPPIFSLNLFCCFSPIQVVLLHRFKFSTVLQDLGALALLSATLVYLAYMYRGMVNDKQIIFGQVYREYHIKLVNPRLFVRKESIAVGTSADDNFEDEYASLLQGNTRSSSHNVSTGVSTSTMAVGMEDYASDDEVLYDNVNGKHNSGQGTSMDTRAFDTSRSKRSYMGREPRLRVNHLGHMNTDDLDPDRTPRNNVLSFNEKRAIFSPQVFDNGRKSRDEDTSYFAAPFNPFQSGRRNSKGKRH